MKKFLVLFVVLLLAGTAFAQADPVAYIIGAETQSENMTPPIVVESILVQLNDDIDYTNYGTTWTWGDVVDDFSVLDGTTVLDVYTIQSNHTNPELNLDGENHFVLTFELSGNYGPAVDYLELYYLRGSTLIPTVSYGNLQTTTTAQSVNDGIKPVLVDYTIISDFVGNPYFANAGSVVTVDFESNEPLASIPVSPTVTFTVAEADYSETVSSVLNPDNQNWRATFSVPATPALNGKVNFTINFRDLRDNQNSLGPVDEDNSGNSVWIKSYDPLHTYAGATFNPTTLPTPNENDTDDLIYLWNVFNTAQECIDAVDVDGFVWLATDEVFDEQLRILTEGITVASHHYPASEFEGYATIQPTAVPVAGEYDIEIFASGVTLESLDLDFGDRDSQFTGIAVGEYDEAACPAAVTDVTLTDLYFWGDGVMIQTGYTIDVTGLLIDSNYFYFDANGSSSQGGQGIYINPFPFTADLDYGVFIENNYFYSVDSGISGAPTGAAYSIDYAIAVDADNVYLGYNVFEFNDATLVNRAAIRLNDWYGNTNTNITIEGNELYGNDSAAGILAVSGEGSGTISAVVNDNRIAYFDEGINLGVGTMNFEIFDNIIADNVSYGLVLDTPADPITLVDADYNYWGDYTGPYNETYNPEGLGNEVSNDVNFSHWWTDPNAPTDFGSVAGSSEIAIQHGIDNSTVTIDNVVSNTDGTISMDVTMDYPDAWDANLPHELLTDALITSDVAFNDEAYIKIEGWGMVFDNIDVDGTEAWLSDLLLAAIPGASVRNPLYLDSDFILAITFYDLDDNAREITIDAITARTGNFNYANTYNDVADCTYNNDYRGIVDGDGYLLGTNSVTIQDPMQVALGTTLDIINLSCNVANEISFQTVTTYPTFPDNPVLSNDWLTDAWFATTPVLPNGTDIQIEGWGQTWNATMNGTDAGFWLSDLVGMQYPLAGHSGLTDILDITVTGLDSEEYKLEIWSVTAAVGNFDETLLLAEVSQDQYQLAYATDDIRNPIQYAIDNSTVDIVDASLANTTEGKIEFQVDVTYPSWTTNPELPDELLVDALIEADNLLDVIPAGVIIDVYYGGLAGTQVSSYTTQAGETEWWLSDMILDYNAGADVRPPLKTDFTHSWGVEISNLDAEIHNITVSSIASDFATTARFDNEYLLGEDTISIQDPMQVALGTTLVISDLAVNVADELSFIATVDYPVFTDIPDMSSDWLVDAWLDLGTGTLPTVAEVWVTYNGNPVVADWVDVGGQSEMWLSDILGGPIMRTPLIGHDDLTDVWGITLRGLDSTEYTLNMYSVTAAADNFVDPTLVDVSLSQYVLAEDDVTFQDPIQYAMENSTLEIQTIENIDAGVMFEIDIQYATLPTNPYIPVAPEEELFTDALIAADLNLEQAFPAGTDVTVTRTDAQGSYTWSGLTLPAGEYYVWLSSLLQPLPENPAFRRTLDENNGAWETWTVSIDIMDYENYDFAVDLVAATNPAGFDEIDMILNGTLPLDYTYWFYNPWYALAGDYVEGVQIPEFTSLDLTVSTDQSTWDAIGGTYNLPTSPGDHTYYGDIDLDVFTDWFYIGINAATNTEIVEMNPFYITGYPNPHILGDIDYTDGYTFWEYWASRGVDENAAVGTWQAVMWQILNGNLPFFYVRATAGPADSQVFEVIDGLQYAASGGTVLNPMRINGDYFLGNYTFEGYIYSADHDIPDPVESNGVDVLQSDLIIVNLNLLDQVVTTIPDFDELYLQDQVQGSNNWIDLEEASLPADILAAFDMYLNEGVEYYDINIKDTSLSNYDLAPQYHPFYLDTGSVPIDFYAYWTDKGVYEGCPGTWEPIMWDIINGDEPMFFLRVDNDQNMMLVDGLQYALDNMPTDEDIYVRINGDYPLGSYLFNGQLMGINGTSNDQNAIFINFLEAEVVFYDLIIWEDYDLGIMITEHPMLTEEDINMVVDTAYDMTVNAIDVNDIVVEYYPETIILFETNYSAYVNNADWTILRDGTAYIPNGIMSTEPLSDLKVTISGELFESVSYENGYYIVEEADVVILPPECFEVYDVVPDQGGFVYFEICRSPNDPFYIPGPSGVAAQPYIDHYTIERYSEPVGSATGSWEWFESIDCYDNESNLIVTGPKATIGSDDEYEYRVTAVYVPNSDETQTKVARVKEEGPTDEGAQSPWLLAGSPAAAADNIPAYADITVYLEGAYISGGVMQDGQTKPLVSPYNGDTIDALPLPNDQIIDWIWIELRQTASGATVKECNAFVLLDGSVIDVEGNSSLPFFYTTNEDYYLVIRHRNHLDIMSAITHQFSDDPMTDNVIDLSAVGSVWDDGFKEVETGIYAMMSGDANGSNLVNSADAVAILDNWNSTDYNAGDLNLSGLTNSADAIHILNNLNTAGSVPDQGSDLIVSRTKDTGNRAGEDCTLEITNVNVVPGVSYSFDVYITRNASWTTNTALGALFGSFNSTLVMNVTNNAFANPVIDNLGSCITSVNETLFSNKLQVELVSSGTAVPTTPELLFSVTMDIDNPNTTAGLSWNNSDTIIYDDSNFAQRTTELIGGDNSTLPVVLSSFTASYVAQFDHVEIDWSTASEDGNAGWNLYRGLSEEAMAMGEVVLLNQGLIPGAGTTTQPTYYDFIDDYNLTSGTEYWYWLESVDLGGEVYIFDPIALTLPVDATPELPNVTLLKGNYPNPFNPVTEISYSIMEGEVGVLSIFNAKGQRVHKVELEAGNGSYSWDAAQQASGIYFYRLQTDTYNSTKKMLLLK